MTAAEKQQQRQQQALPLLGQFKDWLDKSSLQVLLKSAVDKVIAYTLKQWPKLIRYLEHGLLGCTRQCHAL